jgi:4-amino-4-deoxy-L-arabinose transferase-like glycosyltransferase
MKSLRDLKISNNQLFWGMIIIISLAYNYNRILFYKPVGIHQWRNSVTAAFPLNIYMEGDPLKTKTNALWADEYTSDVSIVEFPIVYYMVSMLYKVFGPHDFLFRLVNLLIGYLGLFALFKTVFLILKNRYYALFVSLIVFTSPIYAFYINNFIPDAVSLSVALIGVYFFFKFYYFKKDRDWYYSMLFLALAGLIKTPSLIFYFALGFLLLLAFILKKSGKFKELPTDPKYLLSYFSVFIVLVGWYAYAKIYTDIHSGSASAVEIRPIWILSRDTIQITLERMKVRFFKGTYHSYILLFFTAFLFILNLLFYKKYKRIFTLLSLLSFIGSASFTIVFFRSMRNHDYYQINNLIFIVFVFLTFFEMIRINFPRLFKSKFLHAFLGVAIVFLLIDCRDYMRFRYSSDDFHFAATNKMIEMYGNITPHLREMGISRYDTFYCSPDASINISLYLLDQKGFTDFMGGEKMLFSEKFKFMQSKGLQYVIIGDTLEFSKLNKIPFHKVDFGTQIAQFGETRVYRVLD